MNRQSLDLLIATSILGSVIVLCFVVRYFVSILVLQSSRWGRESWLLCFVSFPMSHDCCVALPYGAMGLSAFFYCGISWSYSLTSFENVECQNVVTVNFCKTVSLKEAENWYFFC